MKPGPAATPGGGRCGLLARLERVPEHQEVMRVDSQPSRGTVGTAAVRACAPTRAPGFTSTPAPSPPLPWEVGRKPGPPSIPTHRGCLWPAWAGQERRGSRGLARPGPCWISPSALSLLCFPSIVPGWRKRGFPSAAHRRGICNEVTSLQKKRPLSPRVTGLGSGMCIRQLWSPK